VSLIPRQILRVEEQVAPISRDKKS
jgi:hypothetical protein